MIIIFSFWLQTCNQSSPMKMSDLLYNANISDSELNEGLLYHAASPFKAPETVSDIEPVTFLALHRCESAAQIPMPRGSTVISIVILNFSAALEACLSRNV